MRVWKLKQKLMRLLFIYRNVIYFVHNSAFQVPAAMCTAGSISEFAGCSSCGIAASELLTPHCDW